MVSSGTPVAPGRTHHFGQDFAVGTSLASVQSVLPFLASGWDWWALHGMDSWLCNTPAHSWLVLCPDQHFCHSPGTIMWLRNAHDSPDYMILEEKGVTSWSRAENVRATSYFGLPLTISLKDAIPVLSLLESVSRICSYEPISKGGFLSWEDIGCMRGKCYTNLYMGNGGQFKPGANLLFQGMLNSFFPRRNSSIHLTLLFNLSYAGKESILYKELSVSFQNEEQK